jgi:hypothetical protein
VSILAGVLAGSLLGLGAGFGVGYVKRRRTQQQRTRVED